MNRTIESVEIGRDECIGILPIIRSLPNAHAQMIGHFAFLDQMPLKTFGTKEFRKSMLKMGSSAHPHRGVATLTYLFKGGVEHYDSAGHHGTLKQGGLQWMKAGSGVLDEETVLVDDEQSEVVFNGLQFWINLPAKNKEEAPDYMLINRDAVPEVALDDAAGTLRVLVGQYGDAISQVPIYSDMFAYHLKIEANKAFEMRNKSETELALIVTRGDTVSVNEDIVHLSELAIFSHDGDTISIDNGSDDSIELIIFGGEKYNEPSVMNGPFVMSTEEDIDRANEDYQSGKYGEIEH